MEADEGYSGDEHDNRIYRWEPWALMNEEEDNNSAVSVPGRPVAVSCSYIGRLAVAFKQPRQEQVGNWLCKVQTSSSVGINCGRHLETNNKNINVVNKEVLPE